MVMSFINLCFVVRKKDPNRGGPCEETREGSSPSQRITSSARMFCLRSHVTMDISRRHMVFLLPRKDVSHG